MFERVGYSVLTSKKAKDLPVNAACRNNPRLFKELYETDAMLSRNVNLCMSREMVHIVTTVFQMAHMSLSIWQYPASCPVLGSNLSPGTGLFVIFLNPTM